MDRRKFLKSSLAVSATSKLTSYTIITNLVDSFIDEAHAASTGQEAVNYVCLWMDGGVERWYFDAHPAPNGYDPKKINIGRRQTKIKSITSIAGKNYIDSLEYATTKNKVNGKYYLPYLWESILPGPRGNVAMKELANYMISIRGVNTGVGFDAYAANVSAAENPFKRKLTVSAISAEGQDYSFPFGFNASAPKLDGREGVRVNISNISDLLSRFTIPSSDREEYDAKVTYKTNELRQIMNNYIKSLASKLPEDKRKIANALMENKKAAEDMIGFVARNTEVIQKDYDEAVAVYQSLLSSVRENHLNGRALKDFDDKPIHNPKRESTFSNDKKSELDSMFWDGQETSFKGGRWSNDFREYFKGVDHTNMAKTFATIEVFFKYNITNSLKLKCNHQGGEFNPPGDVHYPGENYRLYQHSKFYQALGTCLLSCIERMKEFTDLEGKNVANKTVFHLRSEFDRIPSANGIGSNHNTHNCAETFFSAMISEGPHILGNIEEKTGRLKGQRVEYAEAVLDYKNIWSTVAAICGREPDRNFKSLIKRKGLKLYPATNECKNVA